MAALPSSDELLSGAVCGPAIDECETTIFDHDLCGRMKELEMELEIIVSVMVAPVMVLLVERESQLRHTDFQ